MTKLKTLKDLKEELWEIGDPLYTHDIFDGVLKKEAIKWVKAIKEFKDGILTEVPIVSAVERIGALKILNHLYNLDLKEPDLMVEEDDLK